MQFRRLFALMGLIFSLVLSLTIHVPAQKVGKAAKPKTRTWRRPRQPLDSPAQGADLGAYRDGPYRSTRLDLGGSSVATTAIR